MKTFLLAIFVAIILVCVNGMYIKQRHRAGTTLQKTTMQLLNQKLRLLRDALRKSSIQDRLLSAKKHQKPTASSTKQILIDPSSKTVSINSPGKSKIVVKSGGRSNLRLRIRHKPGRKVSLLIGSKRSTEGAQNRHHVFVRTSGAADVKFLKKSDRQGGRYVMDNPGNHQGLAHKAETTHISKRIMLSTIGTSGVDVNIKPTPVPNIHVMHKMPSTTMLPEEMETEEPDIPFLF